MFNNVRLHRPGRSHAIQLSRARHQRRQRVLAVSCGGEDHATAFLARDGLPCSQLACWRCWALGICTFYFISALVDLSSGVTNIGSSMQLSLAVPRPSRPIWLLYDVSMEIVRKVPRKPSS